MKYLKLFENFTSVDNDMWYHGSNLNFNDFNLKKGSFLDKDYINPIFLTSDINFAESYGKIIYKIKILTSNIFDFKKLPSGYDILIFNKKI